jgi:hypothetical protein
VCVCLSVRPSVRPSVCARASARKYVRVRSCGCVCGCRYTDTGMCLRTCSLTNSAFNAYAPYCLRPFWFQQIIRHCLTNSKIFEKKKSTEYKTRILIFSTTFIRNISHSKRNSARYFHKCKQVFVLNTRYSSRILIKLELSRQIFEKSSNIKFHQNPSNGSRVVLCGRTDRQTYMKLIVAFRNSAKGPKRAILAAFYLFLILSSFTFYEHILGI